jgi:hypothetical protein
MPPDRSEIENPRDLHGSVSTDALESGRYRAAAGCDAATATREPVDLRNRGLIVRTGVGQQSLPLSE